ncbi:hypothetical protein PR048_008654 [Dryococelus australis]|uniref:Uncharacterized protein n=1 Tax=Dryococelus australis TaxID=614101 RepID=A0ABQ9HXT2_9NEOP|nr:hypothetical protein PR048_008654 [Dryococelus australis]
MHTCTVLQSLVKVLQLIRQDLDRERRGKQGVENLARALQQTPTFGADDSQQNVTEKLHHVSVLPLPPVVFQLKSYIKYYVLQYYDCSRYYLM